MRRCGGDPEECSGEVHGDTSFCATGLFQPKITQILLDIYQQSGKIQANSAGYQADTC